MSAVGTDTRFNVVAIIICIITAVTALQKPGGKMHVEVVGCGSRSLRSETGSDIGEGGLNCSCMQPMLVANGRVPVFIFKQEFTTSIGINATTPPLTKLITNDCDNLSILHL